MFIEKQTQTQTHTGTDTQTHTDTDTHRHTDTHTQEHTQKFEMFAAAVEIRSGRFTVLRGQISIFLGFCLLCIFSKL